MLCIGPKNGGYELNMNLGSLAKLALLGIMMPINQQMVMLDGLESPKSLHKKVLPENVSISALYTVIMGEMDPKVAKLVNLAQNGTY